jgi:mercuric ion transport protein
MKASSATIAGSVISGILASACCLGPLLLAFLGISGAAFARLFEPLRPYLLVVTYALLGGAFYITYRPQAEACGPGAACAMPRANRLGKAVLWLAAIVVVLTTAFPWYSPYLF